MNEKDEKSLKKELGEENIIILTREKALENFEELMYFQYGDKEESEKAFKRLKEKSDKNDKEY